ncbi:hypothetical protein [Parvularcula maris]|uniref:Uncharacterized protein n=1 Tax=Parvularcula maris TaxID=2965077 RepID=A0A9X2L893_9PROT|nr:hypothetical protein [Parvularcula maris]MCQ8184915.1 hypothetical protein [Parvularcula maris]
MPMNTLPLTAFVRTDPAQDEILPVPAAVSEEMHRWKALTDQLGGRLSRLVSRPVEAEVSFRMTSHNAYRRELPQPGLLVPVGEPDGAAVLRFPPEAALLLTSYLLGDSEGLSPPMHPSVLDSMSMVTIAEPLAEVLREGFELELEPNRSLPILEEWPLNLPPAGERLLGTFTLRIEGKEAVFDLLFPPLGEALLEAWGSQVPGGLGPHALPLPAHVTLCRWTSDGRMLRELEVGVELALPGADAGQVDLEVETGGVTKKVARGSVASRFQRRSFTVGELTG